MGDQQQIQTLRKVFKLGRGDEDMKKQKQYTQQYLQSINSNVAYQESACLAIQQCLRDDKEEPYTKLIALRFLTQCMKQSGKTISFHECIKKHLKEDLFNQALMLAENNSENFGSNLFPEYGGQDKQLGSIKKTFACMLAYDIIIVWKESFKSSEKYQFEYEEVYEMLGAMGVNFEVATQMKQKQKQKQQDQVNQSQAGQSAITQSNYPSNVQQQQQQKPPQQTPGNVSSSQKGATPGLTKSQAGSKGTQLVYENVDSCKEMVNMMIEDLNDPSLKEEFFPVCKADIEEAFEYLIEIEEEDEKLMKYQTFTLDAKELFDAYEKKPLDQKFLKLWKQICQGEEDDGVTPQPNESQQIQKKPPPKKEEEPSMKGLYGQGKIDDEEEEEKQMYQQQKKQQEQEEEEQRLYELEQQKKKEQMRKEEEEKKKRQAEEEEKKRKQEQLEKEQREKQEQERLKKIKQEEEEEERKRKKQQEEEKEKKLKQQQQQEEEERLRKKKQQEEQEKQQQQLLQKQQEEKERQRQLQLQKDQEEKLRKQKEQEQAQQRQKQQEQQQQQQKQKSEQVQMTLLKRLGGAQAIKNFVEKEEQQENFDNDDESSIPDDEQNTINNLNEMSYKNTGAIHIQNQQAKKEREDSLIMKQQEDLLKQRQLLQQNEESFQQPIPTQEGAVPSSEQVPQQHMYTYNQYIQSNHPSQNNIEDDEDVENQFNQLERSKEPSKIVSNPPSGFGSQRAINTVKMAAAAAGAYQQQPLSQQSSMRQGQQLGSEQQRLQEERKQLFMTQKLEEQASKQQILQSAHPQNYKSLYNSSIKNNEPTGGQNSNAYQSAFGKPKQNLTMSYMKPTPKKSKIFSKQNFDSSLYSSTIAQKVENQSMMHQKGKPSDLMGRPISNPSNIQDLLQIDGEKVEMRGQNNKLLSSQVYQSQRQQNGEIIHNKLSLAPPPTKSQLNDSALNQKNASLQQQQDEHKKKIDQLQSELQQIEQERIKLKQENQQLKDRHDVISSQQINKNEAKKSEMEYTDNYLKLQQEYENKKEEIDQHLKAKEELISQNLKNQEQLMNINQQLNIEKTQKKKREEEINKKIDIQAEQIRKLKVELEKKQAERGEIYTKQKEINDLINKHNKSQKQSQTELDKRNEELSRLKKQNKNYEDLLNKSKQSNLDNTIAQEVHDEMMRQKLEEITNLQKHLEEMKDINLRLKQAQENLQVQQDKNLNEMGAQNAGVQEANDQNILELKQKIQQIEKEKSDKENLIQDLQEDCDNKGNELFEKDKEIRDILDDLEKEQNQNQNLKMDLEQANLELTRHQEQLQLFKDKISNDETQVYQQLQSQNQKLNESYMDATKRIQQLELNIQQQERQKLDLNQEYSHLQKENEQIQMNFERLRMENEEERENNQKILNQTVNEKNQLSLQLDKLINEQELSRVEMQETIHKYDSQLQSLQAQLSQQASFQAMNKTQDYNSSPKQNKPQIFEEFRPSAKRSNRADLSAPPDPSSYGSPSPDQDNLQYKQVEAHYINQDGQLQQPPSSYRVNNEFDSEQPQIKLSDLIRMQKQGNFMQNKNDILAPNVTKPNNSYNFIDEQQIGNSGLSGVKQNINNKKTIQSIKNIDPLSADLIYPFNNPIHYYENKQVKEPKGRMVNFYYDYFKDQLPLDPRGLHRFKRACIHKNEYLTLFQNENLQILTMVNYGIDQEFFLSLNLIFKNIGKGLIQNFKSTYVGNSDSVQLFSNPSVLMSQIQPQTQLTQDLQINFSEVPYHMVLLEIEFTVGGTQKKFTVALPHSINQYMEQQRITPTDFKRSWRESSGNIIRSDELVLDNNLLGSAYDFLKLFPSFFEVNETKAKDYNLGISENRVGGYMFLRHTNTAFLIKVIVQPNNKVVFQMSFMNQEHKELHEKTIEFVLNTFILLYTVHEARGSVSHPSLQQRSTQRSRQEL